MFLRPRRRGGGGGEADDRDERYRDWDNLQYWFRGVEQLHPGYGKFILSPGGISPNG